ncbi:unnamed protein product [Closterium sp. NIES-54]
MRQQHMILSFLLKSPCSSLFLLVCFSLLPQYADDIREFNLMAQRLQQQRAIQAHSTVLHHTTSAFEQRVFDTTQQASSGIEARSSGVEQHRRVHSEPSIRSGLLFVQQPEEPQWQTQQQQQELLLLQHKQFQMQQQERQMKQQKQHHHQEQQQHQQHQRELQQQQQSGLLQRRQSIQSKHLQQQQQQQQLMMLPPEMHNGWHNNGQQSNQLTQQEQEQEHAGWMDARKKPRQADHTTPAVFPRTSSGRVLPTQQPQPSAMDIDAGLVPSQNTSPGTTATPCSNTTATAVTAAAGAATYVCSSAPHLPPLGVSASLDDSFLRQYPQIPLEQLGAVSEYLQHPFGRVLSIFITLTLGWPLYLAFNVSGHEYKGVANHFSPYSGIFCDRERFWVVVSDLGLLGVLGCLYSLGSAYGLAWVLKVYVCPLLIVNMFLVLITLLQHTHPALPHFDSTEWDWLRGALATVDRDYGYLNIVHHHTADTHVAHHMFSTMPFITT